MSEDNNTGGLTPGWYDDETGARRYWDGTIWLSPAPDTVPVQAVTHANHDQAAPEITANDPETPAPAPVATGMSALQRMLLIGGGAFALVVVAAIVTTSLVVGAGSQQREAAARCRTEVVDSLKSPATATLSNVKTLDRIGYVQYSLKALYKLVGEDPNGDGAKDSTKLLNENAQKQIDAEAKLGQETWFVVGAVDSENGFGAMVRNTWTCETLFEDREVKTGPDVTFSED